MGQADTTLSALIGSRICHDLISPIGAISNGIELMGMGGGTDGPEMDLIAHSVENAGARIRFFRIAYGAAGDQMLGRDEVRTLLRDLQAAGRVQMHWHPQESQSRGEVRLAFLALQCCETALAFGGDIDLHQQNGRWSISARAPKMSVDMPLWERLAQGETGADLPPAHVQFALLPALLEQEARALEIAHDDGQITLSF